MWRSHHLISYYTIIWLLNSNNVKGFNEAKYSFGKKTNVENHKVWRTKNGKIEIKIAGKWVRERGREKTVCELPYKFIVQVNI